MSPDLLRDLQVLLDAELSRAGATARRGAAQGVAGLVAAGIAVLGVLLLAVGIFLHLAQDHGPLVAGLWVGGGLIVLAALAAMVGLSVAGRRAKRKAEADVALARQIAKADVQQLVDLVKGGGTGVVVMAGAAFLAGIVAGRRGE
jgi:hypothetical protein